MVMNQITVSEFGALIGLQRNVTNKTFYRVDGTPLEGKYQNWNTKTNEASNDDGVEDCSHMWGRKQYSSPGKWNDNRCKIPIDKAPNNTSFELCVDHRSEDVST